MPRVHYLNVRNGDCSIIQHGSGRTSVIDVSCAYIPAEERAVQFSAKAMESLERKPVPGNFNQKAYPDNPIAYLRNLNVTSIFRFILTHPDMDHMDGIKDLFTEFGVQNFWDTANTKEIDESSFAVRQKLGEDWKFYKNLRDTSPDSNPKRLVYYSGNVNDYYKQDGLFILAPTKELIEVANEGEDWNDASYVVLYRSGGRKILFSGDSENGTWEHILANWTDAVTDLDVLIAPHHGRDSGRDYDFLDVVNPKLTIFGNASSDHLAYDPWYDRDLPIVTNNQVGYVILDINGSGLDVWVKNENYAESFSEINKIPTEKSEALDAWYLGSL